ncbi:MAG: polyisoprenoid-binding protein, partial [Rickettsiales bacterium]|nr:polyisoprenoid-binding protein [Rickettsiales bacterium]
ISTGIPKFDAHLKNEDFFNVEKYTTATFKSTDIKVTGEKTAVITGELSMLGKTAPLELEATLNKIGENPFNNKQVAGFSLRGTVYRSKYGINYALPAVPDSVDLIIEAEGIKAE